MDNKQIEIFKSDDGSTEIEVRVDNDTVWLNQYQISDLFLTDRTSIGRHISNIYKTKELDENSTSAKIAQVRKVSISVLFVPGISVKMCQSERCCNSTKKMLFAC